MNEVGGFITFILPHDLPSDTDGIVRSRHLINHTLTRSSEIFRFEKEFGNWYVFLPSFLREVGEKDDLRMRDGAEILLEHIAGPDMEVVVEISDDLMIFEPEWLAILCKERDMKGGADYQIYDAQGKEIATVWMSPPLKFYYGKYPDKFVLRRRFPIEGQDHQGY